jgi:uncharacterized protein YjfI (DUF2170 family)
MIANLDDLVFRLNNHTTNEGTRFDAVLSENGVIEVVCSNVSEFQINIASTETQLLSVTPLFLKSEIKPGGEAELNELLLQLSPAVPLSSIGLQGNTYILFGAMPLETSFESIVHELEVQAENTVEVLDAIEPLLV